MTRTEFRRRLPGYMATGLVVLATALWTFWGVGEMYYEGWWGAWYNRLPYLVPALNHLMRLSQFCFLPGSWCS